jgi:hypothetical protein
MNQQLLQHAWCCIANALKAECIAQVLQQHAVCAGGVPPHWTLPPYACVLLCLEGVWGGIVRLWLQHAWC